MECDLRRAFDPFDEDFAEQVKTVTNGGANVAIEVTGNGGGLNGVLDCMKKYGRVYYHKVHGSGIALIGAHTAAKPNAESYPGYWTTHDDVMAMQRLYQCGRLTLSDLAEETYSPVNAPKVYT